MDNFLKYIGEKANYGRQNTFQHTDKKYMAETDGQTSTENNYRQKARK